MASAIRVGLAASAMAVFMRTPSKPSSMARVASDAVPTPASTMSGTSVIISRRMRRLAVLRRPRPLPIRAPRGMTGAGPAEDGGSERQGRGGFGGDKALGEDDVVRGVGQDGEALLHQDAGGFESD